jgi:PKD repeat protein
MLLFFSQNSQATRTGPTGVTGWTQLGTLAGGSARTTVWSKVAQPGDAGELTRIALSSQSKGNMVLAAYRGVEDISAIESQTDAASLAARLTPNASVEAEGSWAVSYWMHGDGTTTALTPPAGVAVRSNGSQTGGGRVTGLLADSGAMVPLVPYGGLVATAAAASTTTTTWTLILSPEDGAPVNQPPVASFTADCELLECSFDGSASSDDEGPVASYKWEFGDGTTTTTTVPTTTHAYDADGVFTAKLTVTDGNSLTGFATRSVTVAAAEPEPTTVSYVGAANLSRTSITQQVAIPANVQAGDTLLLFLSLASTAAITDPAGWQPLATQDGGSLRTRAWTKVAVAADAGATVNVSVDGSIKGNLAVAAYRGVQAGAPVFASAAVPGNTTARTTPVAPVAKAGSWAVSYWAHRDSAATTMTAADTVESRTLGTQTGGGRVTTLVADSAGVTIPVGSYGGVVANTDAPSQHGVAWTVILAPE